MALGFEFIREKVKGLYCADNGRPVVVLIEGGAFWIVQFAPGYFDEIVLQALRRGMVDGKTLYTDSTHLKANLNKGKFVKVQAQQSVRGYLDELDRDIAADREKHGKKSLPPRKDALKSKEIKQSTTNVESGYISAISGAP